MDISEVFSEVFSDVNTFIREEDLDKVCVVSEDENQGVRVVPLKALFESKDFELERVEDELRTDITRLTKENETLREEKDLEVEAETSELNAAISDLKEKNENLRVTNESLREEVRLRNRRIQEMERIMNNHDITISYD